MTSGDSLRQVAQLVDALERAGVGVENVTIAGDGDRPLADLSVRLPDGDGHLDRLAATPGVETAESEPDPEDGSPRTAAPEAAESTGDDGGGERSTDGPEPDADERAALDDAAARGSERANDDPPAAADPGEPDEVDAVPCRVENCDRTFESAHGMKIHAAKTHGREEAAGTQPHRDPERLREVYEREDTFEEMRAALDADVTAQTVRRNMMKFGVHEPEATPVDGYAAAAAATEPDALDAPETDEGKPDEGTDRPGSGPDGTGDGGAEPSAEEPGETGGEPRQRARTSDDDPTDAEGPTGDDPTGAEATGNDVETAAVEQAEDTVADGGPQEPRSLADVTVPDSMALPDEVDLEALAAATRESRTLYEFAQSLGVDRPTAQELLATFDLLELVTGRLSNRPGQELPDEEVVHRILDAVDARSAGGGTGASAD